jgi:hypothetical protein
VLESAAQDTVEPVGLARDLGAREGEDIDYKANRQPWHSVECQKNAADRERRRDECEYKASDAPAD